MRKFQLYCEGFPDKLHITKDGKAQELYVLTGNAFEYKNKLLVEYKNLGEVDLSEEGEA